MRPPRDHEQHGEHSGQPAASDAPPVQPASAAVGGAPGTDAEAAQPQSAGELLRRDVSVIDALRMERAGLVQETIRRRRAGDAAPDRSDADSGAGAAPQEPAAVGSVVPGRAGAGAGSEAGPEPESEPQAPVDGSDDAALGATVAVAAEELPRPQTAAAARDSAPEPPAGNESAPPTAVLPVIAADPDATPSDVVPAALELLRRWRSEAERSRWQSARSQLRARSQHGRDRHDPASELQRAVESPEGRSFLRSFVDEVLSPEDLVTAGNGLGDLADRIPPTVSARLQRAFRIGAVAGPGLPWLVVPALRRAARELFAGEFVPHGPDRLHRAVQRAGRAGVIPRVRLVTERVLGERGAQAALRQLEAYVADPLVPEVEFTLADVEPDLNLWDLAGTVERITARLAPVYVAALGASDQPATLPVLRATSSRDLELSVRVFMRLLDDPALRRLSAAISLPAQFPEATGLLRRLSGWAHLRREDLGAPIRVGITRAADLGRERVDAVLGGWRLAVFADPRDVDASVVRLLDFALQGEHVTALHAELDADVAIQAALGIALSTARRGRGMRLVVPAGAGEQAIRRLQDAGAEVVVRVPVLPETGIAAAAPYLLERIEQEAAAAAAGEFSEAALTGADASHPQDERLLDAIGRVFQLPGGQARRQQRVDADRARAVTASIPLELFPEGLLEGESPATPQQEHGYDPDETSPQARLTEIVLGLRHGRGLRNTFRNTPDTDPSLAGAREWAARIQQRIPFSTLGVTEAAEHAVHDRERIELLLHTAATASDDWAATTGWERAAYLERVAKALEANRARLIEVAASEFGVPVADADSDVSRAVDLAAYSALLARRLDRMQGAAFHPVGVTVVLPPASPPVSGAAAGALSALAAGSAVIIKASPKTRRTQAVLTGVLWDAQLPRELVQLAIVDDDPASEERLGRLLITDDRVQRLLMHGSWDTARTLLGWRPDLPLVAGTSGKNSIAVTPAADLDQAAIDVARSAFLSTGQRPGHAGTVILVGQVSRSQRFLRQLADAVTALRVGYPSDPGARIGPLVEPADAQLRFSLSQLGEGERWLVEPRQLDDTGRLWTPGVLLGVRPGSYSHLTEVFGPVLGVMHALTLGEAIDLQNATTYGLAAGLQSHDRAEIGRWIHEVQAGSLYINRDTLGTIVQRQPFGGWRRSAVGTAQHSGGPNALIPLGTWRIDPGQPSPTLHLRGMDAKAVRLIEAGQEHLDYEAFDRVRRAALSAQIAWNEEFGEVTDAAALGFERNLLRYLPAAVTVRLAAGGTLEELLRVLVGARIVRAVPEVSVAFELPASVAAVLAELEFPVRVEGDLAFARRLRRGELASLRIRLIGGRRRELCQALGGDPEVAIWSGPVTFAGRVELLPFLREQSISITAHRHGEADPRVAELFAHERIARRR